MSAETAEFKTTIQRLVTVDEGNYSVTCTEEELRHRLFSMAFPYPPIHARQDVHVKNEGIVFAYPGDEGLTSFIPDPIPNQWIVVQVSKIKGKGKVHLRTETTKDTKIAGSTNYAIEKSGTGVRLYSYGGDYISF